MAVELKNRIDSKTGSSIPVMRLLKGPTLAEMSVMLHNILNDGHVNGILSANPPDVDSLSDTEVETLLQRLAD